MVIENLSFVIFGFWAFAGQSRSGFWTGCAGWEVWEAWEAWDGWGGEILFSGASPGPGRGGRSSVFRQLACCVPYHKVMNIDYNHVMSMTF
jgi:hypothetical protein